MGMHVLTSARSCYNRAWLLGAQGSLDMWRFPLRLRIDAVMDRVVLFAGDEWERCEWCSERMGMAARHESGSWLFVCPACAEPWLCAAHGPLQKAATGNPGGPWWFWGFSRNDCGPRECSSGWGGTSMSEATEMGGLFRLGSILVWVHTGNRHRARGIRLETHADRPRSWRVARALTTMNPQDDGGAGGAGVDERDRTWDNSDEAIQLQNALRDDGRRHGECRWLNLRNLMDGYRRLGAFSFDDLWSSAGLAYRHGTRRFECFWQRAPGGGWDVWVQLREEHRPNRNGR